MVKIGFRRGMSGDIFLTADVCVDATVGTLNSILRDHHYIVGEGMRYVHEKDHRAYASTDVDAHLFPEGPPEEEVSVNWSVILSTEDEYLVHL